MTQLVIHTGLPTTGAAVVRDQLAACREPLERAGVALVGKNDAKAWDRAVRLILGGEAPQPLKRLLRGKDDAGTQTVLLSSKSAMRVLTTPRNVAALGTFSRDHGLTTKVVLVVREQLDLLNAMYCRRVIRMETSRSFESFVIGSLDSAGFDLADEFEALQEDGAIQLIAVPYSSIDEHVPAASILEAAELPGQAALTTTVAAAPGSGHEERQLPGPVLVTAARLLHKRLLRLGVVRRRPAGKILAAARQLREHAAEQAWDQATFWGWSPELATSVAQRYDPGNATFAARAWGTTWPDPPATRVMTRLDLPSESPALVSDVMTTIQRVVDELVARPSSRESDESPRRTA